MTSDMRKAPRSFDSTFLLLFGFRNLVRLLLFKPRLQRTSMSAQPHERRIHTRVMLQCTGSLPSRGASRLRGERASDKAGVARKRTGCRSSDASSFVKPRRGSPSPGDGACARRVN